MPFVKDVSNENGLVVWRGYYPLARRVLAVFSVWAPAEDQTNELVRERLASGSHKRQLRVYVDAVPGKNHNEEWQEVARHGSKVPESVARALFPRFDDCKYMG